MEQGIPWRFAAYCGHVKQPAKKPERILPTLKDLIADGRVHVFDGAMGTMLYAKGFFLNVCYDELSVKQSRLVREVHEEYIRAGAEILETNTFGANPLKLGSFGLADDTEKINRAAAELARGAAGTKASVVGAIGPLGIRIEPFGPTSQGEAEALFGRQARGLIAGGVDGFILETFSDLSEIHAALRAVRAAGDLPVVCQMTIGTDGLTYYGTDPETFTKELTAWGADVIGVNCSVGPGGVLEAVEKMVKVTDRPISAQPNAGLPKDVGDRKIYLASPEYMASYARRMIEAGARFVVADFLDVLRRGAAAASDEARARFDHPLGVARHVLRGGEVDLAVAHVLGQAGVGLGRNGAVGRLDQFLHGFEHAGRPDRAIHADHVGAP